MSSPNIVDQLDVAIDRIMVSPETDLAGLEPEVKQLAQLAAELRCLPRAEFKDRLKADLQRETVKMVKPQAVDNVTALPTLFGGSYVGFPVRSGNFVASFLLHAAAMTLVLTSGVWMVQHRNEIKPQVTVTLLSDPSPFTMSPAPDEAGGGGGGGDRDKLDAPKGNPPRFTREQLAPPAIVIRNEHPKLAVEATVVGPPNMTFPQNAQLGNPLASIMGLPSNGTGSGGGIGNGTGGGVGSGRGPGVGPGSGGGIGGGVYRVGGGVSAPVAVYDPEPEYSEEARKAKYQGVVLLWMIIDANGHPRDIRVQRSLGMGLDEKAVEAVKNWKFSPAKKDGQPVSVQVNIEVNFRLY